MKRLIVLVLALVATAAWADKPEKPDKQDAVLERALERYKDRDPEEVTAAVEAFRALEAVALPTFYAGEMPNEGDAYVPSEFYVSHRDLDTSTDYLFLDLRSLTPSIGRCLPTPEPENGIVVRPVPGAVGRIQCKSIFGNPFGSFERIVEVGLVPAGNVTQYMRRITFDFLDVYE